MALRTVLSQGGYSVGNGIFEANVILANGDITTSNITSTVAFIGSLTGNASGSAATVTTAAQPNITSVGSLTGLTVSNATGIIDFTTSANVTLGAVANLHISGGSNGYILSTNGSGALSWAAQSGGNTLNISQSNITGGNITNSISNVTTLRFDTDTGFSVTDLGSGNAVISLSSTFKTWQVTGQSSLVAVGEDTVQFIAGTGMTITTNNSSIPKSITFNSSSSNIVNGNSNVSIPSANGNVNISAVGNANIIVVTGTGVNVAGTLNTTGNTTFTGANVNLGAVANLHISGGANGYVLSTDGSGALSWISAAVASGSNIVLDTFSGNGVQTVFTLTNAPTSENYTLININGVSQLHSAYTVANANVTLSTAPANGAVIEIMTFNLGGGGSSGNTSNISNGTSNVSIATSDGNVTTSVAGNANIIIVTGTGVNVAGTLNATGNLTAGNANLGNLVTANFFTGNGYLLTGVGNATAIVNGNSNVSIPSANGNVNISAVGNANVLIVTGTGVNVAGTLNATGNLTVDNIVTSGSGGNITGANVISANLFVGSGASLTSLAGANVTGTVPLATTAGTITTAAQPNITSTGTLTGLTMSGAIAMGNSKITGLATPTADTDASTKAYVDSVAQGLDTKASVIAATTANITLSGTQTVDGIVLVATDRVLVKNQTATAENGIYLCAAGAWTRTTDMDTWAEVPSAYVFVETGTTNADTGWVCTANAGGTIGTTSMPWAQFSGAGSYTAGTGLTLTGTAFSVNASQTQITSVGTLTSLAVTGNISAGNANLGNLVTANFFTGNGYLLTGVGNATAIVNGTSNVSIPSANGNVNISAVGNANILIVTGTGVNVAGTLNTTGNLTAGNISASGSGGNITNANVISANLFVGSNANLGNLVTANFFTGNGYLLTGVGNATAIVNGNSNVSIPSANGNVNISAAGNANILIVTGTGVNVAGTLNTTGNLTAGNLFTSGSGGNLIGANVVSANLFVGSGANLTSLAGANITGTVPLATTAGTVTTAAQPNITSTGTLTSLSVTGNISAGNVSATTFTGALSGNATTAGTVITAAQGNITSVGTLTGLGVNGTITGVNITANSGVFTGNGSALTALNASNVSTGSLDQARLANASVTLGSTALTLGSTVTTVAGLTSVTSTTFVGALTGAASSATTAGTVTTAAQGNITSVGTLTSLAVTGNISAGNVSATTFTGALTGAATSATTAGTVTTAAQPNITSVGSLTGLTISNATGIIDFTTSANVTLGSVANLHISGGTANYVLQTDGAGILTWVAQSGGSGGNASNIANGTSNVSIATSGGNVTTSVAGNANIIVVTGTGVNVAGTLNTTGNTTFTGANVNLGAVANLHISGGTTGYVLSTDGSGTLSWISAAVATSGANIVLDTFSGNGVQTVFTLTNAPTSENYTLININGVSQLHSAYTVANANVTLSTAPVNGAVIEVMTFNLGSGSSGSTYVEVTNNTSANVNTKYIVNTDSANLTITLPSSPALGDEVGIIDGTGNASVHAITIGRNGGNIQGAASNMTVTTDRSAFTLVYYNVTQGWILTNV